MTTSRKIKAVRIMFRRHGMPTGTFFGISDEENKKLQESLREQYKDYEMIITYDHQ